MTVATVEAATCGTTTSSRILLRPGVAFGIICGLYMLLMLCSFGISAPPTKLYYTDYWELRANVLEVIRHGVDLSDPIYGEQAPSRQFTPWTLGLGFAARLSGLGPDAVMALGALLVSALFLVGVQDFARQFYRHAWAPVVLFAVLCFAWGFPAIIWTGFHPLRSQMHSNYYPASVVFALTFIVWAQVLRMLNGRKLPPLSAALTVPLVAFSLVVHPLNAFMLGCGAAGLAVLQPGIAWQRRGVVLAVLLAGVGLACFWPYFEVLGLAGNGVARGKSTFNNFSFFFDWDFLILTCWPAMIGLAFLKEQLAQPAMRLPIAAAAATLLLFVAGGIADVSISHRMLAFVLLALQLMLAGGILARMKAQPLPLGISWLWSPGNVVPVLATAFVLLQLFVAVEQLDDPGERTLIRYPRHDVIAETSRIVATLPPGAVVMGMDSASLVLPAFGVHVAAYPRPMVFSRTDDQRQADYVRFFQSRTSNEQRRAIIARWGVTHVAFLTHEIRPKVRAKVQQLGPITTTMGPWRIIALKN